MQFKILLVLIFALFTLSLAAVERDCAPDFCNRARFKCKAPECTSIQVEKPRGPGNCDCCPICEDI